MKYELEKLDKHINHDLKELIHQHEQNMKSIQQWVMQLTRELERVKMSFINAAFGSQSESQIERYIQYHQVELIRLTDRLNGCSSDLDNSHALSIQTYITQGLVGLKELLTFIENHFSRYFNIDADIPRSYHDLAIPDFKSRLHIIHKLLPKDSRNQTLANTILLPIRRLVNGKAEESLTFRKLMYFKKLLKEIEGSLQAKPLNTDLSPYLMSSMIYMNFNSYKFFAHCTGLFTRQYQEKETLTEQLDTLAMTAKMMNQTQQKPGVAYRPKRSSLRHSLISWIDEEANFLMKRHQLSLNLPARDTAQPFKLNTSLSVAQLAYLIRIMIEENIILHRNQREVLTFFAHHTRTKKAENISVESLRTRYYNIDTSTKEAVKDVIINLLNNIRKNS